MPLYDFQCTNCREEFEEQAKVETISVPCPSCGADSKKLVSTPSFILKGEGFYSTRDQYE